MTWEVEMTNGHVGFNWAVSLFNLIHWNTWSVENRLVTCISSIVVSYKTLWNKARSYSVAFCIVCHCSHWFRDNFMLFTTSHIILIHNRICYVIVCLLLMGLLLGWGNIRTLLIYTISTVSTTKANSLGSILILGVPSDSHEISSSIFYLDHWVKKFV